MLIIELFAGDRSGIRALFEQADDSLSEIDRYIETGDVFVARVDGGIAGHVQLIRSEAGCEIKSIATVESFRRQGIGTSLVRTALEYAASRGCTQVFVGTAIADLDAIHFYEGQGFRLGRIERNVFIAERGYPEVDVNGIQVRDRAWFSIPLERY